MQESLLHGLWLQQSMPLLGLKLTSGEELYIWDPGKPNKNAGPDFLNARIAIGDTLWAGHVELHFKSTLWNAHGHGTDPNYQNVILHVVWEDDGPVLGYHATPIPTLQLKDYVSRQDLLIVLQSENQSKEINCKRYHHTVPVQLKEQWWISLYRQRILSRSDEVNYWLIASRNNWEKVLFISLLKSFGLHINAEAFLSMGLKLDFSIVQKLRYDQIQLEALFLGMSGVLDAAGNSDSYTKKLQAIFQYQCIKYSLHRTGILPPDFLRLRPSNFPTIRLSQFSVLLASQPRLFGKLMALNERTEIHKLMSVCTSDYWETHYTFGKRSKKRPKKVSARFVDLLIINSVVPVQLMYHRSLGKESWHLHRTLLESCPPEHNHILSYLSQLDMRPGNALQSQALLQMYNHYCTKNQCLECAIGRHLLKGI